MFIDTPFDLNDYVEETRQEARWAGDDKLFVRFSVEPVLNSFKSAEAGRPIYDEAEFVTIIAPGNRLASVHALLDAEYKARFKTRYDRWKQGQAEVASGTPLEAWGRLTVAQVAELKAVNVRTVEQLATLPDSSNNVLLGFYGLKEAAQKFIASSEDKVSETMMAKELQSRDEEIAALKAQLEMLANKLSSAPTAAPAKKA